MLYNIDFITDFIFIETQIHPCEVILVPGGSHPQLAKKAAELFNQGMAKYILFSGHSNPNITEYPSEAEFLKSVAIDAGVPSGNIICETKASHTFENAVFSLELLKKAHLDYKKLLLVCKAYHSRRALLTYQCVFPNETEFCVAPTTDRHGLCADNWTEKSDYILKVMGEVERIGKYFKDKVYCIE